MSGGLAPAAAPEAALGRGDPTRRHAVRDEAGRVSFPGLTRPEAEDVAARGLGGLAPERVLVRVTLPVVLSDGAGPHLVNAAGRLVLVVGPHAAGAGHGVAMGEPGARQDVGVVRPLDEDRLRWEWVARAGVPEERRVEALDALLEAASVGALGGWEAEWRDSGDAA